MSNWREYGCFIFYTPGYRGKKFRYKQYFDAFKLTTGKSKYNKFAIR